MASRVLTPANQITILRLIFIPIFAILVIERNYGWALATLTAAAISDVVDGAVARIFHQESPLGVALDPLADKILMTTAYLVLAFRDVFPWWLTITVISRDVAMIVTAALISVVAGYRPFRPSVLGKMCTTVQVFTVFVAVGFQAGFPLLTLLLLQICIYLAAAFTLASGIHYLIVVRHRYTQHESAPKPSELTENSGGRE